MSTLEEKIFSKYGWTPDQTKQVFYEYERFLQIKSSHNDIYPPDKIKILWEYHILCTELYNNYTNTKFGKLIHYNKIENLTNDDKIKKIIYTINIYKTFFGNFTYVDVWDWKVNINPSAIQNLSIQQSPQVLQPNPILQPNQIVIPTYYANKITQGGIKIFIKYLNQNKPGQYNLQTINLPIKPTDTYYNIKQVISENILYPLNKIKLIPHPDLFTKNILNLQCGEFLPYLNANNNLNKCDFIIAEITE